MLKNKKLIFSVFISIIAVLAAGHFIPIYNQSGTYDTLHNKLDAVCQGTPETLELKRNHLTHTYRYIPDGTAKFNLDRGVIAGPAYHTPCDAPLLHLRLYLW